jgi:hypothetical protein
MDGTLYAKEKLGASALDSVQWGQNLVEHSYLAAKIEGLAIRGNLRRKGLKLSPIGSLASGHHRTVHTTRRKEWYQRYVYEHAIQYQALVVGKVLRAQLSQAYSTRQVALESIRKLSGYHRFDGAMKKIPGLEVVSAMICLV